MWKCHDIQCSEMIFYGKTRSVNPCVVGSSPTGGAIVNTHFRYQLRKVEFKVGIFLYWHKFLNGKFEI